MPNIQTGKSQGVARDNTLISKAERNPLSNYDRITLEKAATSADGIGPVPYPSGGEPNGSVPTLLGGVVLWLPQRGGGALPEPDPNLPPGCVLETVGYGQVGWVYRERVYVGSGAPDTQFGNYGDTWIQV